MKTEIEVDFLDDAPIFDWDNFAETPARSWRQPPPVKLTRGDVAIAACAGFALFLLGMVLLVCVFCM